MSTDTSLIKIKASAMIGMHIAVLSVPGIIRSFTKWKCLKIAVMGANPPRLNVSKKQTKKPVSEIVIALPLTSSSPFVLAAR